MVQTVSCVLCREYFTRAVEGALQISVLSADRLTDHGVRPYTLKRIHLPVNPDCSSASPSLCAKHVHQAPQVHTQLLGQHSELVVPPAVMSANIYLCSTPPCLVQLFGKGSLHAVVSLGSSTFKTRPVVSKPAVSWDQSSYLYLRHVPKPFLTPLNPMKSP